MHLTQLILLVSALSTTGLAFPTPSSNEVVARSCLNERDPDKRVTGGCSNYKRDAEAPESDVDILVARACIDKRDPDKRVTGACGNYKRGVELPEDDIHMLVARACVDKRDPDKRVTGACGNYKRGSYSKFADVPEVNPDDD